MGEQIGQQRRITAYGWEVSDVDLQATTLEKRPYSVAGISEHGGQVDVDDLHLGRVEAGQSGELLHVEVEALGGRGQIGEALEGPLVDLVELGQHQMAERRDLTGRCGQIVADGTDEGFHLLDAGPKAIDLGCRVPPVLWVLHRSLLSPQYRTHQRVIRPSGSDPHRVRRTNCATPGAVSGIVSRPPGYGAGTMTDEPPHRAETDHGDDVDRSEEWEALRAAHLRPRAERPASMARGVHHVALLSSDVGRTIDFYQGLLGFPLVELFENRDYRGSTHFFFDIGLGNCLAFFDFPGLDLGPYAEVLGGLHHLAISVEPTRWAELRRRLDEAGVDVVHHSGSSLYFSGPDGERIELISDPLGEMYGHPVG